MGPPSLEYDISSKKRAIAATVVIILTTNVFIPVGLYFYLTYHTNLSQQLIIIAAQTSMLLSLVRIIYRWWQLLRNHGERAPRNRTRWSLDNFQWQSIFGAILVSTVSITASVTGSIRLLTISYVALFAESALQLVLTAWMSRGEILLPFRVSSQPPGTVVRPLLYTIMEDLVACDGGGGAQFRTRANERYTISPPFQTLMYNVSLLLGLSFLVICVIISVLIPLTPGDVSFGISMALLWGWSVVSAWLCVVYARRALALERQWWRQKEIVSVACPGLLVCGDGTTKILPRPGPASTSIWI